MRTLLNPKWLWLLNTLPLLVLLALLSAEYGVMHTLLPPKSLLLWQWFGAVLVLVGALHVAYAAWLMRGRKALPWTYGAVALAAYMAFLYAYGYYLQDLFPSDIPRWMVPGDLPLYAGTFLMPTLAHAAAVLVVRLTPNETAQRALPNFGMALAVPLAWYAFAQLVLPLWQQSNSQLSRHALVILLIVGTLAFLLFLARGVYILAARRAGVWEQYQWLWKLLIAGVLPLLGLAVNNGLLFSGRGLMMGGRGGIFGDFMGLWWYGLALLNAGLLCWPAPAGHRARLALYLGRGVLLSYTLYFFLVFLPFLPLSVVAVAAAGVGFLLLTPLVLFIVHLRELAHDYAALRTVFAGRWLALGLLAAVAVLPLAVTVQYAYCRAVLHNALDYVYAPDYARTYHRLNTAALGKTLAVVRHHKERRGNSLTGAQQPYLSAYFNWLVLDNLTLSEEKIATLEQVFFGLQAPREPLAAAPAASASGPALTRLAARSHYDARQQAWISWLDLTISNPDSTSGFAEYATTLELPAGCSVSNYYLDMHGRRELGILAEKRAAAWVYSQIRNENHDPGLLHYLSGNRLALRVFPFEARETRRTGVQLLHKEVITLTIDGQTVALGNAAHIPAPPSAPVRGGVAYVSAAEKAALPVVRRQPYYHFVIDMSAGKRRHWYQYRRQIQALLRQQREADTNTLFSLTNTYVTTHGVRGMLQVDTTALRFEGGFYLDRAIRQVLVRAVEEPQPRYPIIVVVSADFDRAVLPVDFADLRHAYPESDLFYELTDDGRLLPHSMLANTAARQAALRQPVAPRPVVAWPTARQPAAYLPATTGPDLVLTTPRFQVPETALRRHEWRSGLLLQALWRTQLHHPETTDLAGRQLVRYSFRTGILTPLTAFLALENEAQKAALRRKQAQLLAGHAALDAGETEQRMSEPGELGLLLGLAALGLWQWCRRRGTALILPLSAPPLPPVAFARGSNIAGSRGRRETATAPDACP